MHSDFSIFEFYLKNGFNNEKWLQFWIFVMGYFEVTEKSFLILSFFLTPLSLQLSVKKKQ